MRQLGPANNTSVKKAEATSWFNWSTKSFTWFNLWGSWTVPNTPQKLKTLVWFSCREVLGTKTLKPAFLLLFVCFSTDGVSRYQVPALSKHTDISYTLKCICNIYHPSKSCKFLSWILISNHLMTSAEGWHTNMCQKKRSWKILLHLWCIGGERQARDETVTVFLTNIITVNHLAWVWTELSAKKRETG